MSGNKARIAKTIVISGAAMLVNYAITFLLTPFITEHIGIEAYGFVSISKNLVSYAGIITVALTAFIVRYISVEYHKGNIDGATSFYSSSICACSVITVFLLIVAVLVAAFIQYVLVIPESLVIDVKILFFLVSLNFAIITITTPYSAASYIKNRLDLTGIIKFSAYIVEAICMVLIFSILKPQVWLVGVASLIASTLTLMMSVFLTKRLVPDLKYNKCYVSFSKIKSLLRNGIWDSLNQLGNVLNSGLDLLISNLMLSSVETGQIAVAKTIGTLFTGLFQVVFQPFQPVLLRSYAQNSKSKFVSDLKRAMVVTGMFGNIAFAGFCALGNIYFRLWLPGQEYKVLHLITILTVANYVTDSLMRPVYYIGTLTLKNKVPCIVTISGGVLNLLSMYILLKYTSLGVYSIAITTAVIMILINLLFNPIYAAKCLNISKFTLYPTIVRHFISCCLMIGVFKAISVMLHPESWLELIGGAVVMAIIGVALHVLIMLDRKERKEILVGIRLKMGEK